jgi:predicted DCC family thiol-disulfide oxidoreductase YuxK
MVFSVLVEGRHYHSKFDVNLRFAYEQDITVGMPNPWPQANSGQPEDPGTNPSDNGCAQATIGVEPEVVQGTGGSPRRRSSGKTFRELTANTSPEILYYDGQCGLCHRGVKFVLKHDRSGTAFRFAPLQGVTFQARVPVGPRDALPDTMAVQTASGSLLIRTDAFVHILRRLGGGWRILAATLAIIPRPLRDLAYNFVARTRHYIFGQPDGLCPVVSASLRARFDP